MRFRALAPLLPLLLFCTSIAFAGPQLDALAKKAVSANPAEAKRAIAELRAVGPDGLKALLQVHAAEIERQISSPLTESTAEWQRLNAALDAVSQQKNSYLSGLYWYTDIEKAKAVARASHKPILSLRLLGKLSEEFSCANSRFFRTVLYSNSRVSNTLRENFVLHWQSERPAPRVTIDFGDGRKLERTLTGNSIHYILDTSGKPIDALPGLYGPAAFLRALSEIEPVFQQIENSTKATPAVYVLATHQRSHINATNLAWASDIQKIGGKLPEDVIVIRNQDGTPSAIEITSLAITKAMTETSILRNITAGTRTLGSVMDETAWNRIAAMHLADGKLDQRSISLIRREIKNVPRAAGMGRNQDTELENLVNRLERNIALDTVRNEYLMRPKVLAWIIRDRNGSDLETLNRKVYSELFLTPASDPWLGLFSTDTYVALDGSGISH